MKLLRPSKELTVTGLVNGKRTTVVLRPIPCIDGKFEVHFAYDDGVRIKIMTREEYHNLSLGAVLQGALKFDRIRKFVPPSSN